MRTIILLLPLLCFVNGRNLHEQSSLNEDRNIEVSEDLDLTKNIRDSTNQMRHRRRSRQSFYAYPPYYYENNRRDYVHLEDTVHQIFKLLQEVSLYVNRPPPPPQQPQIVYVPYPVPYPMPQYRPCVQKPQKVNLTDRWPDMEDDNMNWGLIPNELGDTDDGSDGSRPVSFEPYEPNESVPSPPPVEHGSQQAGMDKTTRAPSRKLGKCEAAIIICCELGTRQDQQNCFLRYGCPKTYSTGISCQRDIYKQVIEEFAKAYAPNKNR